MRRRRWTRGAAAMADRAGRLRHRWRYCSMLRSRNSRMRSTPPSISTEAPRIGLRRRHRVLRARTSSGFDTPNLPTNPWLAQPAWKTVRCRRLIRSRTSGLENRLIEPARRVSFEPSPTEKALSRSRRGGRATSSRTAGCEWKRGSISILRHPAAITTLVPSSWRAASELLDEQRVRESSG